jgi:glycosyltransferase involved in cell wall biosynthesis
MKAVLLGFAHTEYSVQQANGLARQCEVLLMLPEAFVADYKSSLDPKVKLFTFEHARLRQLGRHLLTASRLVKEIRRFNPDVIHFQQGQIVFNFALTLLRSYPLVMTIHDPRFHIGDRESQRTPQWVMDFGFRRADRVIVHGEALKRQAVEAVGLRAERVHVIPHVGTGHIEPPAANKDDGKTILFFGRIWDYKGLTYLIQAEPIITQEVPGARIVIAGTGDNFEQYRRMMTNPDRFVVHNRFISRTERDELFRESTIVALPYIEATQSGVIPLAYSHAKPVVATNVGALTEAVDDGRTGRSIAPADPRALANAIIELLRDPARCRGMGAAARHKFESEWSPVVIGRQVFDVYQQAIQDRVRPSRRVAVEQFAREV